MQQIVHDYIEQIINQVVINNYFNHEKNTAHEVNSNSSDISITPPQSTKCGSNNGNKDIQQDKKPENKKILFILEDKANIIKKKNNNNDVIKNKFLIKKRKRIFSIQKIGKKYEENTSSSTKKIIKKKDILKENISSPVKCNNHNDDNNIIINIIKNNDKKNNNNYNINNSNNNKNNNNNNSNSNTNNNINNTHKNNKENNDNNNEPNSKKKKKRSMNEKDMQLLYEQKFLENINKEYSDKEYERDINECLKDKKKKFMKENFPIMFQKDYYYLYSVLPKKRLATKAYYIDPNYFNDKFNENLFGNYNILYDDYDLFYKETTQDSINNIHLDIKDKIQDKNFKKYLNNIKNIHVNDENVSSNINKIGRVENIIDINENMSNNYKYHERSNKYINDCSDNKIKIFKIYKIKKIIKNKNNIIPENNKNNLKDNNSEINESTNSIENNNDLIIKEKNSLLPKKVWSFSKNNITDIDIDNFFDDCVQVWPFDECCFTKEIAMEFLMKNNYNSSICLKRLKEFVYFMKKRAKELDFPIIDKNIKTIKRYNLRKSYNIKYNVV